MNQNWHNLIQDYLAGKAEPKQVELLEQAMRENPELRELYLKYAALDVALENRAEAETVIAKSSFLNPKVGMGWLRQAWWQTLLAAAACVALGFISSSVLWATVVPKTPGIFDAPIIMGNPGFENPDGYRATTRPRIKDFWNGDPAVVVGEESGFRPSEGRYMLRLEPKKSGSIPYSRIEQVIDLSGMIPPEGCGFKASFSFRAEAESETSQYIIKVFVFDKPVESIRGNLMDLAIADARRKFTVERDSGKWRTGSMVMDIPPSSQTLMIDISAQNPENPFTGKAHYIDDVKASLILSGAGLFHDNSSY